jgi:hypothetical protein
MNRNSTLRRTGFKQKTKEQQRPRRYGFKRSKGLKAGKTLRARPDRPLAIWSKQVRERDDYTCQKCGRRDPESVIAHHVAPRSRRRDLKYELSNGVTLCEIPCHRWVHARPLEATREGWLSDSTYEAAQKERRAAA